jgi:hypothetical protein
MELSPRGAPRRILLSWPKAFVSSCRRVLASSPRTWGWRKSAGTAAAALAVVRNLVEYYAFGREDLHPFYVVWYVTLRCNLACAFCDDGTGKKYPEVRYPEVGTADAVRLLELVCKLAAHLLLPENLLFAKIFRCSLGDRAS